MVGGSALSLTRFITNVQPRFTCLGLVCATPCSGTQLEEMWQATVFHFQSGSILWLLAKRKPR